jgi:hypothetical protein
MIADRGVIIVHSRFAELTRFRWKAVGCNFGEPVSDDYGARGNEFNGKVKWVQIDLDDAARDVDHMNGAEERFSFAMARQ